MDAPNECSPEYISMSNRREFRGYASKRDSFQEQFLSNLDLVHCYLDLVTLSISFRGVQISNSNFRIKFEHQFFYRPRVFIDFRQKQATLHVWES